MELPKPFTEANITKALEDHLQRSIQLKNLQVAPNEAGGNYCSDIYRITINYIHEDDEEQRVQVKHLLLKALFEMMSENSREFFMYETVLPEMNEILSQLHKGVEFSPRVYLSFKEKGECHLFEDLNAGGYVICDRLLGYDEAQTKCVLQKLGQYHAVSMVYKDRHPDIVSGMKEFFAKSDPNFMLFVQKIINDNTAYVTKIIETWAGYEKIAEKMLSNTGETFKRKFLAILEKENCSVRVLAHGDLWIKNILVLEDEENGPKDAVFLDYQNCFDGSPGLDLNNLLMTSVQLDVMNDEKKRRSLFEHYYKALNSTLIDCNYDSERIPKFQQILDEIQRTEYFTYYDLIFAFPQTNLSEDLAKGMDFGGFYDEERLERNRRDMFSNPRVLETYKYMLQRFDAMGILD